VTVQRLVGLPLSYVFLSVRNVFIFGMHDCFLQIAIVVRTRISSHCCHPPLLLLSFHWMCHFTAVIDYLTTLRRALISINLLLQFVK